jgi:hypothetical protein
VCDFGSVQVKDLMFIERYSHVMHIVSSVEGRLAVDKTNYDLMRATFPAGTVSGALKIRAMQIIADLEGTMRGPGDQPRNTRNDGARGHQLFFRVIWSVLWFERFFPVQETVNQSKAIHPPQ